MYSLTLGVWAIVAAYAILHDQYIVRIAPEHFTIYHGEMWGLTEPKALAAAWAFGSSWYPGILLGMVCTLAARADASVPRVAARDVLKSAAAVVCLVEASAAISGLIAHRLGHRLYPARFYHAPGVRLQLAQTIQLTSYWASAVFSITLTFGLVAVRCLRRTPGAEKVVS